MLELVAVPLLLVTVGAVRVVPQLVGGGVWGGEASLAAVMIGLGVAALVGELRARRGPCPASAVARTGGRIADRGRAR